MATEKTGGYYLDKVRLPDGREGYMARGASDGSKVYLVPVDEPSTPVTPEPEPAEPNDNYKLEDDKLICEPDTNLNKIKETYPEATATNENLATGSTVTIEGKEYTVVKYGDVNMDGSVTSADASQVLQHAAQLITLDGNGLLAARVNSGTGPTSADAALILQYAAQLIDKFPIEN